MPYRRSYRRRYRRRRYPRKSTGGTDYVRMAKMAYTGVKYLKSIVNVEKHPLTVTANIQPNGSAGIFRLLNGTTQGDEAHNRQGNSILMKSINANLRYTINSAATATTVRTIMFWDREANGATPTASELLTNVNVLANYKHTESTRFKVIADFRVSLSATSTLEITRRIYRRFMIHTHYDGNTGDETDIVDYALWIFCVSDENTNLPEVTMHAQVLFIDN